MNIYSALPIVVFIISIHSGIAHAQNTPPPTPSALPANSQAMGNMPGMDMTSAQPMSAADMQAAMKHCAQMRVQMANGMKMTADMQPMMKQCDKMDRSMEAAPAPADTLSR